jgi:hypothetical protein
MLYNIKWNILSGNFHTDSYVGMSTHHGTLLRVCDLVQTVIDAVGGKRSDLLLLNDPCYWVSWRGIVAEFSYVKRRFFVQVIRILELLSGICFDSK